MLHPHRILALALTSLLACSNPDGQVGEEGGVTCGPIERIQLSQSEESLLGFSADDVLQAIGGMYTGQAMWADGTSSPASLSLDYQGGHLEYQDREWVDDGDVVDEIQTDFGSFDCSDIIAIDLVVTLQTDDGRLAESWQTTIEASSQELAELYLSPEDYMGDLEVESFAPQPGETQNSVDFRFEPSGATVNFTGVVTEEKGALISGTSFDIANLLLQKQ